MIQFRPPSLIKPWDEFVSIDPTFIQRPDPPPDATEEAVEAYGKELAGYLTKLKAARETGDWSPLVAEGQKLESATRFTLVPVDSNVWRELLDRSQLPPDSRRHIGSAALRALMVRMSLKSISGCDVKVDRVHDDEWGLVMAKPDIIDFLDKQNLAIVGELSSRILERLRGVGPL